MRKNHQYFIAALVGVTAACPISVTAGFLTASRFPQTGADVSFAAQMENKAAGYAPFAELSPYQSIMLEKADEHLAAELEAYEAQENAQNRFNTAVQIPTQNIPAPTSDTTFSNNTPQIPASAQYVSPQTPSAESAGQYCSQRHPTIPAGQQTPLGNPALYNGRPMRIGAPYTWRGYRGSAHRGVDLGVGQEFFGAPVYATADGIVDRADETNKSMGNYIGIKHANGFRTLYMHLDKMFVQRGQHVSAGCLIGTLGNTGGALEQKKTKLDISISHLHYEIQYTGNQSAVRAPDGTSIRITIGDGVNGHNYGKSINPTAFVQYGN